MDESGCGWHLASSHCRAQCQAHTRSTMCAHRNDCSQQPHCGHERVAKFIDVYYVLSSGKRDEGTRAQNGGLLRS